MSGHLPIECYEMSMSALRHELPLPANGCTRAVFKGWLNQPQFQIGPIGVRVQQGPKLPPL
jgi:hypothetical protein